MSARILCPWDYPGGSMREPAGNKVPERGDLRRAAALLLGAANGDHDAAARLLRELTAEREGL